MLTYTMVLFGHIDDSFVFEVSVYGDEGWLAARYNRYIKVSPDGSHWEEIINTRLIEPLIDEMSDEEIMNNEWESRRYEQNHSS